MHEGPRLARETVNDIEARAARPPEGLSDRMKARTAGLHREAERSGILRELLRGSIDRRGYTVLLRNLLPVYEAMERALTHPDRDPRLAALADPAVYRTTALRADIEHLAGLDGEDETALVPSAAGYAARAGAGGAGLIAHAYVRYLGDLNGGQILKRLIGRRFGLEGAGLTFYDFPAAADPDALARAYRAAIDRAGLHLADAEPVLAEAETAFRFNIALGEEVQRAAIGGGAVDRRPRQVPSE